MLVSKMSVEKAREIEGRVLIMRVRREIAEREEKEN